MLVKRASAARFEPAWGLDQQGQTGLFAQMDELQKRFADKKREVETDPTAEEPYADLLNLSAQVNELQDKIDRELALSFGLAKRMSSVTIGESNEILSRAKSCMERGKIKEAIEILDSADTEGGRARLLRRKAEEVDEARLDLREYSSLVDLELFRMDALMRLASMPLPDRQSQVREWAESLLAELDEFKQNTPGPLEGDIDSLAERVRSRIEKV